MSRSLILGALRGSACFAHRIYVQRAAVSASKAYFPEGGKRWTSGSGIRFGRTFSTANEDNSRSDVSSEFRESEQNRRMTLFVGNLPWTTREDDLKDLIGNYTNNVISARIVNDKYTGRSRGFGYVDVPEEELSGVLKNLQGIVYKGRSLKVSEATNTRRSLDHLVDYSKRREMHKNSPRDRFHNAPGKPDLELSEEQREGGTKSIY